MTLASVPLKYNSSFLFHLPPLPSAPPPPQKKNLDPLRKGRTARNQLCWNVFYWIKLKTKYPFPDNPWKHLAVQPCTSVFLDANLWGRKILGQLVPTCMFDGMLPLVIMQYQVLVAMLAGSRITEHPWASCPNQLSPAQFCGTECVLCTHKSIAKQGGLGFAKCCDTERYKKVSKKEHLLFVGQQRCLLQAQCPWSGLWHLSIFPFPSYQFVHSFCADHIFCASYFCNFLLSCLHLVHMFLEGWSRMRNSSFPGPSPALDKARRLLHTPPSLHPLSWHPHGVASHPCKHLTLVPSAVICSITLALLLILCSHCWCSCQSSKILCLSLLNPTANLRALGRF